MKHKKNVTDAVRTVNRNEAQSSTASTTRQEKTSSRPSSIGPLKIKPEGKLDISTSWAAVKRTFGTSDPDLSAELLLQVTRALPTKEILDPGGNYALAALYDISPRDTIEGMLATQMVAGHNQAMEFLRRAALPCQPSESMELYLNLATRLQRTFVSQVEALDRHRGKGEPKMSVEQLHFHDRAQGIVGPFSHERSLDASAKHQGKSNGKSN